MCLGSIDNRGTSFDWESISKERCRQVFDLSLILLAKAKVKVVMIMLIWRGNKLITTKASPKQQWQQHDVWHHLRRNWDQDTNLLTPSSTAIIVLMTYKIQFTRKVHSLQCLIYSYGGSNRQVQAKLRSFFIINNMYNFLYSSNTLALYITMTCSVQYGAYKMIIFPNVHIISVH